VTRENAGREPPGELDMSRLRPASNRFLRRVARSGSPHAAIAANQLGGKLADAGKHKKAERWYREAAEAGLPAAAFNLGTMLFTQGRVIEAEPWLRSGAEKGDVPSMFNLGSLLWQAGMVQECMTWWRRAAEAGDTDAQTNLGTLLLDYGDPSSCLLTYLGSGTRQFVGDR
jgi:TPR repeat protein